MFHPEASSFITATSNPFKSGTAPQDSDEQSLDERDPLRLSQRLSNINPVQSDQVSFPQPYLYCISDSTSPLNPSNLVSKSVWLLEAKSRRHGGPVSWMQPYRIRHVASGYVFLFCYIFHLHFFDFQRKENKKKENINKTAKLCKREKVKLKLTLATFFLWSDMAI